MEEYIDISKADMLQIKLGMKSFANLEESQGTSQIQSSRYFRDCMIGDEIGVSKMNHAIHGWDGKFDNGIPFENKNVSSKAKSWSTLALQFKDTSTTKLDELCKGVIATQSIWENSGSTAYIMIGNTKYIGEALRKSYNPESRNTCMVGMRKCLNSGFKLVAMDYTKQQVIDHITNKFPGLGKSLNSDNIFTREDLPALVASIME